MSKTKEQIVEDIQGHKDDRGGAYKDWYVGISKDAKDRLFNGHKVKGKVDAWIWHTAISSDVAREVEDHFQDLGMDGDKGGGSDASNQVYAYKKKAHTDP